MLALSPSKKTFAVKSVPVKGHGEQSLVHTMFRFFVNIALFSIEIFNFWSEEISGILGSIEVLHAYIAIRVFSNMCL